MSSTGVGAESALSVDQQRQIEAEAASAVARKHSQVPVVAGAVKSAPREMSGDIFVTVYPACSAHRHTPHSCCNQVCCNHTAAAIRSVMITQLLQLGLSR